MRRNVATLICFVLLAQAALASEMQLSPSAPVAPSPSGLPAPFVFLSDVDPTILQDMRYAGDNNFTGKPVPGYAAAECVLTKPAAEALARVQANLRPLQMSLKVYDCYRPQRAVMSFVAWGTARDPKPATKRFFPNLRKEQLVPLGYIAEQSSHPRGVAIDLTLVQLPPVATAAFDPKANYAACTAKANKRAPDNSVDMGTGYDCFDTLSHTASPRVDRAQRVWRHLLFVAMTKEKFENFEKEWWHYVLPSADQAVFDFEIPKRGVK
ncbi:MAG: M15 family metallopeptidase [Micropepsaceae bacterium]